MIIEFKMKNVYSYKDEVTFSMLAPNNKVKNRYTDNYVQLNEYDVLKTALIVGENAGGKSNFINGLIYFKSLFKETANQIGIDINTIYALNCDTFNALTKNIKYENSIQKFSITLSANNKMIYKYDLIISIYGIEYEALFYTDSQNHKFKMIFELKVEHDPNDETVKNYGLKILKLNKNILDSLKEKIINDKINGLIINSLSLLGVEMVPEFINAVNEIDIQKNQLDLPLSVQYHLHSENLKPYLEIMKTNEFLEIFKLIDSSIEGLEINDDLPLVNSIIKRKNFKGEIFERKIVFDSTGVKNFLIMALLIYETVYENKIIFTDEMDSTFNPILTSRVLAFIHAKETFGQFIFTTHNIFNLNLQIFMKEQMYIVEKNKETLESSLYSLKDFDDIRYDSNEKIYEYYMKGILGGC